VAQAKAHLSERVTKAKRGEETIITRRGQPVVRLAPSAAPKKALRARRLLHLPVERGIVSQAARRRANPTRKEVSEPRLRVPANPFHSKPTTKTDRIDPQPP
jgi:prevent-host-death family protein